MPVRLLFAAFILAFFACQILREHYGEIYPGLFMPSFRGNGLHMISPTEGAFTGAQFTAVFDDQTSADVPPSRLFGKISPAVCAILANQMLPNPHRQQPGLRQAWRDWLSRALDGGAQVGPSNEAVPADIRAYLRRRIDWLYPGRHPASMTLTLYEIPFSVNDFHRMPRRLLSRNVIDLHEGS